MIKLNFKSRIGLRFNWIEFKLKRNGIQIGGKDMENLLVLKKKTFKKHKSKKIAFNTSSLGNVPNRFQFENNDLQFIKSKIVLTKLAPINHCH